MLINLFAGYDEREAIGWHVFVSSVLAHASASVAITAIDARGMLQGSNAFTLSRFLVPSLSTLRGHAIFVDASDMLMLGDVAELDELYDDRFAVQVVKHPDYRSRHARKYVGTPMECEQTNYSRKNWMSCAIFNCGHPAWRGPPWIAKTPVIDLLQLRHVADEEIGDLPDCWNRLVDEGQSVEGAKLLHWTNGAPFFERYRDAPGADLWRAQFDRLHGQP